MQKRSVKLTSGITYMLFTLAALITICVIFFKGDTLAWFSSNESVHGNGMTVDINGLKIYANYFSMKSGEDEYSPIESFESLFEGMRPGDSVKIKVEYTNEESSECSLITYLDIPENGEIPLVADGKYYYLGTQLKISERDEFLISPPTDLIAYEEQITAHPKEVGALTIPNNSTQYIEFTVEFVNYPDVDQSAYVNFGNSGGGECAKRYIRTVITLHN